MSSSSGLPLPGFINSQYDGASEMSEGWVGVVQARLKRVVLVRLTTFATEILIASSSALKVPEYTLI